MAIGMGVFGTPPTMLLLILTQTGFSWLLARHEALELRRRYGEAFDRYAKSVPWLLPRLRPAPARGEAHPSLSQGILAEIFSGSALIGIVVLCILQRPGVIVYAAILVAGWFAQQLVGRRLRPVANA